MDKNDKLMENQLKLNENSTSIYQRPRAGSTSPSSSQVIEKINPETDKFKDLMNDVNIVKKFVPNKSGEEILAYLEAFHDNPNRVRIVIGELLDMNGMAPFPLNKSADTNNNINNGPVKASTSSSNTKNEYSSVLERVNSLLELFPDADPSYLHRFVEQYDENHINSTVCSWLENKSYPKLAEAQRAATKRKFMESDFSVEEFLQMFPDPENFFKSNKRIITPGYRNHVMIFVQNEFRFAYKADLTKIMEKHQYHLTPIMKELNTLWNVSVGGEPLVKKSKEFVRKKKVMSSLKQMPRAMDELFYKEKLFIEMEQKIKDYKLEKEKERTTKIQIAKKHGELLTCNCCFEDDLLIDDMLHCADGHLFCRDCIRRQAEVHIGQSKYKFPCLDAYCDTEFPLIILQHVLPSNVFSSLVRKMQEEEIRNADIPDLVSCPFCSFCAIMPDKDNKIFRCLNPECLKVSCRLCREPNHLPLRCDEIEQKHEVKFRTFIEDKMTDALLRTCPKCKRRIIKDFGCNKMTCTCGQMFCYVCREPVKDYQHFNNGKCPQYSNDMELNRLEVQEGAKKAREEFIQQHPDISQMELRHDPTKVPIIPLQNQQKSTGAMPMLDERGQIIFQRPQQPGVNVVVRQVAPVLTQAAPAQILVPAQVIAPVMTVIRPTIPNQLNPLAPVAPVAPVAPARAIQQQQQPQPHSQPQPHPQHNQHTLPTDDYDDESSESDSVIEIFLDDDDGTPKDSDLSEYESEATFNSYHTNFSSANHSEDERDSDWNSCIDLSWDDQSELACSEGLWDSCCSGDLSTYDSCATDRAEYNSATENFEDTFFSDQSLSN